MKKLALIVIVAALSMVPAVTLADGIHFSGVYEMSASGSCLHSENSYTKDANGWYSPNPGVVYAGTTVSNGTWVFKQDGTGTYSYIMNATVTPPVPQYSCDVTAPIPVPITGGIRIFSSSHKDANGNVVNEYTFTYDMTKSGDITILTAEGDTLEGSISIDKKAITLFDALRVKPPVPAPCPWWSIICTATRTLIKVHN
jgi:hypothetical protein